jgi:hypothetical protein
LEKRVFVTEDIANGLVPANFESLTIERDGYRVKANSTGKSVLLLPIEFSRCWNITELHSGSPARLFRANLLLTGVVFEGKLDVRITFHTGPFNNPGCRLADRADSKAMAIENVFQDCPAFGVLGYQ